MSILVVIVLLTFLQHSAFTSIIPPDPHSGPERWVLVVPFQMKKKKKRKEGREWVYPRSSGWKSRARTNQGAGTEGQVFCVLFLL